MSRHSRPYSKTPLGAAGRKTLKNVVPKFETRQQSTKLDTLLYPSQPQSQLKQVPKYVSFSARRKANPKLDFARRPIYPVTTVSTFNWGQLVPL